MLKLSKLQMAKFRRVRLLEFLRRLDGHLLTKQAPRWAEMEPGRRMDLLERSALEARKRGINEEIYVAQFIVLYMMVGADFFDSPDAKRIFSDSGMECRVKVYQLIALAGIDLAGIDTRHGARAPQQPA